MSETLSLKPIGYVKSTRQNPIDDNWDSEASSVILDANQFNSEGIQK